MFSPLKKLHFGYRVLRRTVSIMPRKSKKIKMLYIEYAKSLAGNNDAVLKYRFTNALWFIVDGTNTLHTRIPLWQQ